MSQVHLILSDGTTEFVAHLYENETISLNLRFTDISNFATKGGFSRDFRLPASDDALAFFGAIFSPNFSGGWFDFRTKVSARLAVDTLPIAIGHIQVKKLIFKNGQPQDIECVFYSELPDVVTAIGDKSLKDLTDLPNLNHTLDIDVLADSVADTLESGNVKYSLIDKGQNFANDGTGQPVYDSADPLVLSDFTPSVKALYIWQQIISDAGFYYESTEVDAELDLMFVPWLLSKDIKGTTTPDDALFKVYRATDLASVPSGFNDITGLTEDFDNGANFATPSFTAPYSGTFTFKAWAHFTRTAGGTAIVNVGLKKSTGAQFYPSSPVVVSSGATNQIYVGPIDIFMSAGETIKMEVNISTGTFTFEGGTAATSEASGTGFSLVAASYPVQDYTVSMPLNAPAMKQIDFMRSVITMLNLSVIPDKTAPNKLIFTPLGDFINSGTTRDWTDKISTHKDHDISIYPTNEFQKRTLKWTYKPDGDVFNKAFNDLAGRTYGQIEFKDTGNDFATGEQITQIEFRPTPCDTIAGTNIVVPKFVNERGDFFAVGPRILYAPTTATGIQVIDYSGPTTTSEEVPILSHYADANPVVETHDLNFGMETPLHPILATPYFTLYNRYHRTYVRELYGGLGANDLFEQPLMLEGMFNLNLLDIHNLSFADQIFIGGFINCYWRVLEINDHVRGGETFTRVKLIKKLDVQLECDYVPVAVGTGGQVIFHDGNGDDADGSQTCCELYGYTWNSSVSKCYSLSGGGGPVRPDGSEPAGDVLGLSGLSTGTVIVENTYNSQAGDFSIFADTSARNLTIYLPDASTNRGREIEIVKTSASNTLTIDGNGTNINGSATAAYTTNYSKAKFKSNGIQWYIVA